MGFRVKGLGFRGYKVHVDFNGLSCERTLQHDPGPESLDMLVLSIRIVKARAPKTQESRAFNAFYLYTRLGPRCLAT